MTLSRLFGKLLNVRAGEGRRLLLLYCMSLAGLIGCIWADTIILAAFLQRVGVQYLPWVFISTAACSIGAMFLYSAFADRVSNTRLLIALMVISGTGILLGVAALAGGLVSPAYLLLFLVLQVPLTDVYNVHWPTYVNSFYDIRAAKRVVPVLSTTARFAGIIGGLSMPLMNRLLSPIGILTACVACLAVVAVLAAARPRLLHEQQTRPASWSGSPAVPQAAPALSYGGRLQEGYQQIAGSPFLRWMALSTLCMTVLMTLLNYEASAIMQAELKTTVAISDFLGVLGGTANLVVLPIQMFLLSRLITRLGLGNAGLVFPLATLTAAGGLAIASGLSTAALAYLDRTALRTAFRIPTDNLLYNAVPVRVKARTRAFVGGLIVPLGAILGGLLLLTGLVRTAWFLPAVLLVLGLAFVLAALMVRQHYGQALIKLLEQEDYSSLALQAPSPLEPSAFTADPATVARLGQRLTESTTPERTIFMAQLIIAAGGETAVPLVAQAVRSANDSRLRASLIDVLVATDMRGVGVHELYSELLADSDSQVRLASISGLEQIDGPRAGRYLEVAARLLTDPEIEIRLRVLPALLMADDPASRTPGNRELCALLDAPHPHTRARALRVVGQAHVTGFLPEVVRSLADDADEARLAAALAAEMLVDDQLPGADQEMLVAAVLSLLHDPIERARMAAARILYQLSRDGAGAAHDMRLGSGKGVLLSGRLKMNPGRAAPVALKGLVTGLADASPEVRAQVIEALAHAGRCAIPPVHEQLDAADPLLRKMAAVVLARIDPRTYAPLVRGPVIDGNLLAVYRNLCCAQALAGCPGPAVAVLLRAFRERNATLLDEVFGLLATVQNPAAVKAIARSLRSPQPAERANATEALESVSTPQTARLVGPLCDPDSPSGLLVSLAEQTWDISVPTPAAALRVVLGNEGDAWQRTLAAAALAELSARGGPGCDAEIVALLNQARADANSGVRAEASVATSGAVHTGEKEARVNIMLSAIEKIIFLKEVPFFQGMTVDQLRILADVCEEAFFATAARLFQEGDPGGVLYIVISGRVGIEHEKRKGSYARLATVGAHSYLGETDFFDNNRRTNSAIAIEDTLTLQLRREPLLALVRQHPELSLELLNVLSSRLREANDRITELTRAHPQELHKLFDQLT